MKRTEQIANWLLLHSMDRRHKCPFGLVFHTKSFFSCSFCIKYFNAEYIIIDEMPEIICPCTHYGYDETKKLAETWIEENKK